MSLISFSTIYARAVARKGREALLERLPTVRTAAELARVSDDRYLAMMAQRVFSAGFVWRIIEAKWPGFEEVFRGFEPEVVAALGMGSAGSIMEDTRIVRNAQKINATFQNAAFVLEIAEEYGSFGAFLGAWPDDDPIGLWALLKRRGARLGGDSGPRLLRQAGKDTFILTPDVTLALTDAGVLTGKPTSKVQQRRAQEAFVAWREETGRSFAALSVIAACSVDSPR